MNIDVERGSASTQKHLEVIRLDISELTTPLPEQVKARWGPYKQRQLPHSDLTLDQIQAKLAAADEKRKVRGLRFESNELDLHSTCRAQRCLIYSLVPQLPVVKRNECSATGDAALGNDPGSIAQHPKRHL